MNYTNITILIVLFKATWALIMVNVILLNTLALSQKRSKNLSMFTMWLILIFAVLSTTLMIVTYS